MSAIDDELRSVADIAEAGDKLHWASLMRCAAAQLIAGDRESELLLAESKRLEEENQKLREALARVRESANRILFELAVALAANGLNDLKEGGTG